MALPVPLQRVLDSRIVLGTGLWSENYLVNPAYKDYTTGGYLITVNGYAETVAQQASYPNPTQVPFRWIQSAAIVGYNTTALGWVPYPVFPITQVGALSGAGQSGNPQYAEPGASGYQYFNLWMAVITTGVQVATSVDLSGSVWLLEITGY